MLCNTELCCTATQPTPDHAPGAPPASEVFISILPWRLFSFASGTAELAPRLLQSQSPPISMFLTSSHISGCVLSERALVVQAVHAISQTLAKLSSQMRGNGMFFFPEEKLSGRQKTGPRAGFGKHLPEICAQHFDSLWSSGTTSCYYWGKESSKHN